jgi:hypothetical protein
MPVPVKRAWLLAMAIAGLAGCRGAAPAAPDEQRHRCIEIPNGLVECTIIPADPPARAPDAR